MSKTTRETASKKPRKEEQERDEHITETISALLTAQLTEHKEALLTEIKDIYAKYEARLDTIQATVNDHQQRICDLEHFANSTGDVDVKLAALASENAKLRAKVTDLEGRSRRNNIRIVGLPEGIEGTQPTIFFSRLLVEVLGAEVLTSPPELDRAHRTLAAKPGPSNRPRAVLICFHQFQTRERVIRAARKLRGKLTYNGSSIHIFEDFTSEVAEQRAQYRDIMRKLYNMGLKPVLRYPARLSIVMEDGTRKPFSSVREATDFVSSRPQDTQPAGD